MVYNNYTFVSSKENKINKKKNKKIENKRVTAKYDEDKLEHFIFLGLTR